MLLSKREAVSTEQHTLSLNGDEKLLRAKGIEALTIEKTVNLIVTNTYETTSP